MGDDSRTVPRMEKITSLSREFMLENSDRNLFIERSLSAPSPEKRKREKHERARSATLSASLYRYRCLITSVNGVDLQVPGGYKQSIPNPFFRFIFSNLKPFITPVAKKTKNPIYDKWENQWVWECGDPNKFPSKPLLIEYLSEKSHGVSKKVSKIGEAQLDISNCSGSSRHELELLSVDDPSVIVGRIQFDFLMEQYHSRTFLNLDITITPTVDTSLCDDLYVKITPLPDSISDRKGRPNYKSRTLKQALNPNILSVSGILFYNTSYKELLNTYVHIIFLTKQSKHKKVALVGAHALVQVSHLLDLKKKNKIYETELLRNKRKVGVISMEANWNNLPSYVQMYKDIQRVSREELMDEMENIGLSDQLPPLNLASSTPSTLLSIPSSTDKLSIPRFDLEISSDSDCDEDISYDFRDKERETPIGYPKRFNTDHVHKPKRNISGYFPGSKYNRQLSSHTVYRHRSSAERKEDLKSLKEHLKIALTQPRPTSKPLSELSMNSPKNTPIHSTVQIMTNPSFSGPTPPFIPLPPTYQPPSLSLATECSEERTLTCVGDYTIIDEIGKGRFAIVYRAKHKETGQIVAIKESSLNPSDLHLLPTLKREAGLLENIDHPNIVKIYQVINTKKKFYIILEYISQGDLFKLIKQNGVLSEPKVSDYMKQVLLGLQYLHNRNIIHRDIKSANLLMDSGGVIKLADFGTARLVDESQKTMTVIGTPFWMAPEIINFTACSVSADIWSLGCTCIELLTGQPPYFNLPTMSALYKICEDDYPPIPEGISEELKDFLINGCFVKDPSQRATAEKLLEHNWIKGKVEC